MMSRIAALALVAAAATTVGAVDWPQWRGPNGNGVSAEKNLPVAWGNDKNIAWRAKLDDPPASGYITVPST